MHHYFTNHQERKTLPIILYGAINCKIQPASDIKMYLTLVIATYDIGGVVDLEGLSLCEGVNV